MTRFGFRLPDFPMDGSDWLTFFQQIKDNLNVAVATGYDSAWIADHFIPWVSWESEASPSVECCSTSTPSDADCSGSTSRPLVRQSDYRVWPVLPGRDTLSTNPGYSVGHTIINKPAAGFGSALSHLVIVVQSQTGSMATTAENLSHVLFVLQPAPG